MPETPTTPTSGAGGSRGPRSSGSRAAGGVTGAGAPPVPSEAGDDAAAKAEATSDGSTPAEAPAEAPTEPTEATTAPSGELRWYRAIVSMGEGESKVKAMEKFTATADDPRVLSGWVTPLGPVVPDDVAEAFAALEGGLAGGLGSTSS